MINKLTLNNQIVSMRKVIRQAKVHVIRKLIRESKKLRQRKTTNDLKEKYDRKADRRVEEIMIVKKINLDDVSKFALKNTEDPSKKIMHADTTVEERALYRLVGHKNVAERVKQFRDQYPDWTDYIGETIEELGARRRKSTKELVKLEHKDGPGTRKPLLKNRHKKDEEIDDISPEKGSSQTNIVRSTPITKTNEAEMTSSDLKQNKVKSLPSVSQWTVEDLVPVEARSDDKDSNEIKEMNSNKILRGKENPQNKKPIALRGDGKGRVPVRNSGMAEVRKFSELIDERDEVPVKKQRLKENDEGPTTTDKKTTTTGEAVDPFFVTADGKSEYLTSVVLKEVDEEKDEGQSRMGGKTYEKKWDPRARDSRFERGRPGRGMGQRGRSNQFNREGRGDRGARFGVRADFRDNKNSYKTNSEAASEDVGHLHPSWEAKRKLKEQSISNVVFQGKKIKFDDDDD